MQAMCTQCVHWHSVPIWLCFSDEKQLPVYDAAVTFTTV